MTVTDDAFLGGALRLLQPRTGYRAGIDAVFLAAAVPCVEGRRSRVLDVGAGVGTAGLCVARRCPDATVVLLERQIPLLELARENIARNGLTGRVRTAHADLGRSTAAELLEQGVAADSFDHVIANPPFHIAGEGTPAQSELKSISHEMPQNGLEDWCRFCARMAKSGATVTLIHKVDALPLLLEALKRRFGDLKVLPIHARAGEPAIRVLIQGTKGSKAPLTLLPAAVLHGEDGRNAFTSGAAAVLRHGRNLDLACWKGFSVDRGADGSERDEPAPLAPEWKRKG